MRLLDFVEQNNGIRTAAHRFGKLSSLFVSNIAWGGAHETADCVALLIFAHVDADHGVLVVEQELGKGLRQFGLARTGGAKENKTPCRA